MLISLYDTIFLVLHLPYFMMALQKILPIFDLRRRPWNPQDPA